MKKPILLIIALVIAFYGRIVIQPRYNHYVLAIGTEQYGYAVTLNEGEFTIVEPGDLIDY